MFGEQVTQLHFRLLELCGDVGGRRNSAQERRRLNFDFDEYALG